MVKRTAEPRSDEGATIRAMQSPEVAFTSRRAYRVTRSQYQRLAEAGGFRDAKVELLYGAIVHMSPQGPEHSYSIRQLLMILAPALKGRAMVQVQQPLAVSDESEPEPDLSVVAPGDYLDELPRTALLVVEAANESLHDDRVIKGRLYAEIGIPEYWLIDLRRRRLERYLEPRDGAYTRMTTHERGESLAPAAFPDVAVSLDEIVPPPKP